MRNEASHWNDGLSKTIAILKGFSGYEGADFTFEERVTNKVFSTTKFVRSSRRARSHALLASYLKARVNPFAPLSISTGTQSQHIFPVIAETDGEVTFVVDGCHRTYAAFESGISTVWLLLIRPLKALAPPCDFFPWTNVQLADDTISWQERFSNLNPDAFRPVAELLDNASRRGSEPKADST